MEVTSGFFGLGFLAGFVAAEAAGVGGGEGMYRFVWVGFRMVS